MLRVISSVESDSRKNNKKIDILQTFKATGLIFTNLDTTWFTDDGLKRRLTKVKKKYLS